MSNYKDVLKNSVVRWDKWNDILDNFLAKLKSDIERLKIIVKLCATGGCV